MNIRTETHLLAARWFLIAMSDWRRMGQHVVADACRDEAQMQITLARLAVHARRP
jgi:hypothetical protein